MNLAVALALAAVTAEPSAPALDAEQEILVIAQRLPGISVWLSRNPQGKFVCGMNASSGSARMDEQLCKAAALCLKRGAQAPEQVGACINARKPQLMAEFKKSARAHRKQNAAN